MVGLLDRWTKKQEKKQLKSVEKTVPVEATQIKKGDSKQGKKNVKQQKDTKKNDIKKKSAHLAVKGNAHKVLIRPVVSEKAGILETHGQYVFVVNRKSTKQEISRAIQEVYGVKPKRISVLNFEGKKLRFGRTRGKRVDWKKAVIILPKGRTISIHEGV